MPSHEELIRRALEAGKDPHTAWAAYVFGKPEAEVTPAERQQAKAENFCLLYSGSFMGTINWPQVMKNRQEVT